MPKTKCFSTDPYYKSLVGWKLDFLKVKSFLNWAVTTAMEYTVCDTKFKIFMVLSFFKDLFLSCLASPLLFNPNQPNTLSWSTLLTSMLRETLSSVVLDLGVVSLTMHFCIPANTHKYTSTSIPTGIMHIRLHQAGVHIHYAPFFSLLIKLHMHTTKSLTHVCRHRQHTQAFFFFSHSCVQISNSARWERTNTLTRKD